MAMSNGEKIGVVGVLATIGVFWYTSKANAAVLKAPVTALKPVTSPTSNGLLGALGKLAAGLVSGIGGGSGGASSGSGGSSGTGGGPASPKGSGIPAGPGAFGTYVINGQPYDANGNAIDENGNIIPGQFDNTGLGPAGAGINADGTLASNPLEFTTGAVVPLSAFEGASIFVPSQPAGGDAAGLIADAEASIGGTAPPSSDLSSSTVAISDNNYTDPNLIPAQPDGGDASGASGLISDAIDNPPAPAVASGSSFDDGQYTYVTDSAGNVMSYSADDGSGGGVTASADASGVGVSDFSGDTSWDTNAFGDPTVNS